MQGEQMAQGIHGPMQLGATLALGAVVAGSRAALGRRAQGPAVEDRGARLGLASRRQAQHGAQIMRQRLEAAGRHPALRLLVDRRPEPAPAKAGGGRSLGIAHQAIP